jgi:hypothetical protein
MLTSTTQSATERAVLSALYGALDAHKEHCQCAFESVPCKQAAKLLAEIDRLESSK